VELFVSGRVCLFGEHSDWAGGFRKTNSDIPCGHTIVVGTSSEGLYAKARPHASSLLLTSTTEDGERMGPFELSMKPSVLLAEAKKGGFWSYAAGVAYHMAVNFEVKGIELDNYRTTLPMSKGLSSSAAMCVLMARAFSMVYDLKLSIRGEMEYAYQGEILTPSKCGRMDQACAYGPRPVVLTYDGDQLEVEKLIVGEELFMVVADLNAAKDTVTILRDLQAGYPYPADETQRGVHTLLGAVNVDITTRSIAAIAAGDLPTLGGLMLEAQTEFDRYGGAACPSQLVAPVLHKILAHPPLLVHVWGGKGVGSQGDGTAQFLCKGAGGQSAVCGILEKGFGLHCLRLNIPMSTIGESTPEEVKQEGAASRKQVPRERGVSFTHSTAASSCKADRAVGLSSCASVGSIVGTRRTSEETGNIQ